MLDHVGATLPDDLINDTVFSTPRTDVLSESICNSNRNSHKLKETEKSKVYLKEINNNLPEYKVEYTVNKGNTNSKDLRFPTNNIYSDFSMDVTKPTLNMGEKRKFNGPSTATLDKENQKYY